jgi:hypothetical protein
VTDNNTVANIQTLMATAKPVGIPVFTSRHCYYSTDHGWCFEGTLEK